MRIKVKLTFVAESSDVPISKVAMIHAAKLGLQVLEPLIKEALQSRLSACVNVEPGALISVESLDKPPRRVRGRKARK